MRKLKRKLKKREATGPQKLIHALVFRVGGPAKLAQKTEAPVHFIENAIRLGNIQPYAIRAMTKALKAPFGALDYKLYYMIASDPKSWKSMVKACKLPRTVEQDILRSEGPNIPEVI